MGRPRPATLRRFFHVLGPERSSSITHVGADPADWIAAVAERCPNALRGADAFEVVARTRRDSNLEETQYWIWRFEEPDGGDAAYATVSVDESGSETIGYETDYYGLSPEQFILGDFHGVF